MKFNSVGVLAASQLRITSCSRMEPRPRSSLSKESRANLCAVSSDSNSSSPQSDAARLAGS